MTSVVLLGITFPRKYDYILQTFRWLVNTYD